MSRFGHPDGLLDPPTGAALVGTFALGRGERFTEHRHPTHQLAWARTGVVTVAAGATTWVLPPSRALWIPAGLAHVTTGATAGALHSLYVRPERAPAPLRDRPAPVVLAAGPLFAALVVHLGRADLEAAERARAEAVLFDQLRPAPVASVTLAWPVDGPARAVADAWAADPADARGLAAIARAVGTSERSLTRAFRAATGLGPGRWRARLRVRAALELLAAGVRVGPVAAAVGYATPSAFVAAFRRELGTTPAQVFTPPTPA